MTRPKIADLIKNAKQYEADPSAVLPDPVVPTRIRINLTQVIPYINNPRKTRNPKFDEIKESIRAAGLDTPPDVTRESPSDPYMIRNGGNTRLEILNELWDETQDPRFYEFDCIFHPWTNEFDLFIAHVKENELRGQMSFIERALAAKRAKDEFELFDGKSISTNQLSKRLSEKGWPINDSNLGQLLYAEETLLPLLPKTFWDVGIGRPAVKEIRKVLDHCGNYWSQVATPEDGDFQQILKKVCEKLDGDGFDVERLEYDLCGEMSRAMGGGVSAVQSQIQALAEKIIQPENLTRPSKVNEHFSAPLPEKPVKSIAKTKAKVKKLPDSLNETTSDVDRQSAIKDDGYSEANTIENLLSRVFPKPGYPPLYGFMHELSEEDLKIFLYHRVMDAFMYFPDIDPQWRSHEFTSQFIVKNKDTEKSLFGFDVRLTDEPLVRLLSRNQKYLGQIVYLSGLLPARDHLQYTQYFLSKSGPLSAEDAVGLSLQYQLYRRVYCSFLSMHESALNENHLIFRAWNEMEMAVGTLTMNYSDVSLI
jgi:ParB family protein of integrating conjugative element (PFGI_1 class)